jgi:endonuclease-3
VPVGALGRGEQVLHGGDRLGVHLPLEVEAHGGQGTRRSLAAMARPRTPKGRTREVARRLAEAYPEAVCELDHRNAFELLAATILSAQTTDARVNLVTPALFDRYPTAHDLAAADPRELEEIIRSTGFYQAKSKSLIGMATALVERYGGEVPTDLDDLVTLPGVGRKTGNVVRSVAFDLPGLPVDTHVIRLSNRLALTTESDPVRIEHELNGHLPAPDRGRFSLRMILHGRRVCLARAPRCEDCVLEDICPASRLPTRRRRPIGATHG